MIEAVALTFGLAIGYLLGKIDRWNGQHAEADAVAERIIYRLTQQHIGHLYGPGVRVTIERVKQ